MRWSPSTLSALGGEDRDNALLDIEVDDLAHILYITLDGATFPPNLQAVSRTGVVGAVFTFNGILAGLATVGSAQSGRERPQC